MSRAIKILVSIGLVAYLLYAVDLGDAFIEIKNAHPLPVGLAIVVLVAQLLISAWKWRISLSIHGLDWRILPLSRILFIALFFNNFLPTAVGGDIYRVYRTLPADGMRSRAISALLLDRVVGLLALLFVGAAGAAVLYARGGDRTMALSALAFALPLLLAGAVPALARSALLRPLRSRLERVRKLEPLMHNARLILRQQSSLARLAGVSLLFQMFAILAIVLLFAGLETTGIVAESAVIGAMYALASLVPISINGIGVMEGSFAVTAQSLGIDFSSAVIVTLIMRVTTIALSLVGALVFMQDKGRAADVAALAAAKQRELD